MKKDMELMKRFVVVLALAAAIAPMMMLLAGCVVIHVRPPAATLAASLAATQAPTIVPCDTDSDCEKKNPHLAGADGDEP